MKAMEFVEIYALSKKPKKIKVDKKHYETIQKLIETVLTEEGEVSLSRLIALGDERLGAHYHSNLSWLIILIKNDMVYRKKIDVIIDQERNQIIRPGRKRFRSIAHSAKSLEFPATKILSPS